MNPSLKTNSTRQSGNKLKRSIDIIGAIIGLATAGIILLPVAIAMAICDPGPIFYSQMRCGLYGRTFRLWKFRSMVVNADKLKHKVTNEGFRTNIQKCQRSAYYLFG